MPSSWIPGGDDNALPVTRRGLAVASPDHAPDANGKTQRGANGLLKTPDGQMVGLWVNEVGSDFALGGNTAQGPTRRDFYGHNFVQPKLTIGGQTTNNYEYNRLAAFIRRAQLQSINFSMPVPGSETALRLIIRQPAGVASNTRHTRGRHTDIDVEGFIPHASAGAERFVTAHSYQFDFVILKVYRFLPSLRDEIVVPYQIESITKRMESDRTRLRKSGEQKAQEVLRAGAQAIDPSQDPSVNAILNLFG